MEPTGALGTGLGRVAEGPVVPRKPSNVGGYNSATVSVLLGNGDGTFGTKTDYGTGSHPLSVAIGDVNGDGKPDLVTANYYSHTVTVLMNIGSGSTSVSLWTPTEEARLTQICPNPTWGSVTVWFEPVRAGNVSLRINSVAGRLVWSAPDQAIPSGARSLAWNGRDTHGMPVAAGVYYVELRADAQRVHRPLVILR